MIDISIEKSLTLSAQERYDIISFAMDAADDNGFINSFIYERALYCFAAIMFYPEHKDTIATAISEDLIKTWETLLENGTIDKMMEEYAADLDILADEAELWREEYSAFAHSARGILEMVQMYTGNIVQYAADKLQGTAKETGVSELLDIADEGGMNRTLPKAEKPTNVVDVESLFVKE